MKQGMRHLAGLALGLALAFAPGAAQAVGTAAGTVINNTATASYSVGPGANRTATSNTAALTVQQVTDVVVTQVNSPITVNPGDPGRIAIFTVTNTGNGSDTFNLGAASAAGAAPSFTPALSAPNSIAIDTNGNGVYDPGIDAYATATTAIPADGYATVFVFNDIPTNAADGQKGNTTLTATSNTASGAVGTLVAGAGVGGVNAVVGGNGGTGSATATYTVSSAVVSINKTSAVISDPYTAPGGTPQAIPGAVIQYTLSVSATGTATANNVVITDPIPANTTYVPASMTLNGTALTDAADADAGDFNITTPGAITVKVGPIAGGGAAQTITFKVKIN